MERDGLPPEMESEDAKKCRRAVAIVNFMAQDRPDLAVTANVLSRSMARPREGQELGIKRAIRYLNGAPRLCYKFGWQEVPEMVDVLTDSDWAGDVLSRRSTSRGTLLFGNHLLQHWCSMRSGVALSSGEAELTALVRGVSEALCTGNVLNDFGFKVGIRSYCDSSAARGITNRVGVGKMKHLEVKHLWIQQQRSQGRVTVFRVPRNINPADSFTHPSAFAQLQQTWSRLGLSFRPNPC